MVPALLCRPVAIVMLSLTCLPFEQTEAAETPVRLADYEALRSLDSRLLDIGFRLVRTNAPLCESPVSSIGAMLHAKGQYDAAGQAAFSFATDIAILAVAPDSPAWLAGLRPDDGIVAINGKSFADLRDLKPTEFLDTAYSLIENLPRDKVARMDIVRDGQAMAVELSPMAACPSRFETEVDNDVSAAADGDMVAVSLGMMERAQNDEGLAAIVAHEIAHNILRHRERLGGAKAGILGPLGKGAARVKRSEYEADSLSVWLLANADHDLDAVLAFWTDFATSRNLGIFSDGTHPGARARIENLKREMAAIRTAPPGDNGIRVPPILSAPLPSLR